MHHHQQLSLTSSLHLTFTAFRCNWCQHHTNGALNGRRAKRRVIDEYGVRLEAKEPVGEMESETRWIKGSEGGHVQERIKEVISFSNSRPIGITNYSHSRFISLKFHLHEPTVMIKKARSSSQCSCQKEARRVKMYLSVNVSSRVLFGKAWSILTVHAWLQFGFMASWTIPTGTFRQVRLSMCMFVSLCDSQVATWRIDFCMNAGNWFVFKMLLWRVSADPSQTHVRDPDLIASGCGLVFGPECPPVSLATCHEQTHSPPCAPLTYFLFSILLYDSVLHTHRSIATHPKSSELYVNRPVTVSNCSCLLWRQMWQTVAQLA